jgi:predicted nucleic acid-binding protein
MIVVADASPLHYLILIEHITVLPPLYGQVIVPSVVCEELQRPQTPKIVQRWIASPPLWLDVRPPQVENDPGLLRLGAGERQAILLAQAIEADALLMDERHGRREARSRALRVLGTLGILDEAAARGLLHLPTALSRLQETNFRVTAEMMQALLARDVARRRQREGGREIE